MVCASPMAVGPGGITIDAMVPHVTQRYITRLLPPTQDFSVVAEV